MEQDIYVDVLFLINLSIDYLCAYICAKILRIPIKPLRLIAASALGGIYSIISLFLPFAPTLSLLCDITACVLICLIAFFSRKGGLSRFSLCVFLFFAISLMIGGGMTVIFNMINRLQLPIDLLESDGISAYLFAFAALISGIFSLLHGQLLSKRSSISECYLKIRLGDADIRICALVDSGNLVKDPISGRSVILVDRNALSDQVNISPLLALQNKEYSSESVAPSIFKGIRIIPITTANAKSLVIAFLPDSLSLTFCDKKGKEREIFVDSLLALSEINAQGEYRAIVPAEIVQ